MRTNSRRRSLAWALLLGLSAASVPGRRAAAAEASVSASTGTAKPRRKAEDIVWPEPPDKPRVRFVRSIRSRYDVKGRAPGFWDRLAGLFSGQDSRKPVVDGPFGLWVQGDLIYATDPVGQKVVRMDLAKGTVKEISEVSRPVGVTADPAGDIYVTDTQDSAVVAFDPQGKLLWKTDAMGPVAGAFKRPTGIAWTPQGELLVCDSANGRLVVLSKEGKFLRSLCRHKDKEIGALPTPTGLWIEPNGNFTVTDPLLGRVHTFSSSGTYLSGFGELGDSAGYLARPRGAAVDSDGNVYVADALLNRVQIFARDGQLELYFGAPGVAWGRFLMPAGLFIDSNDRIYVADAGNSRVEILQYVKYPPEPGAPAVSTTTAESSAPASQEKKP